MRFKVTEEEMILQTNQQYCQALDIALNSNKKPYFKFYLYNL